MPRVRVAVEYECGRILRTWPDAIGPCPSCGTRDVTAIRFRGREIVSMEKSDTGTVIRFDDGSSTVLATLPRAVV